jgi:hypothetical protein
MTRPTLALAPALALALALALSAGCFTGPEDLSPVCERKDTTPWHPYAPEQLMGMTTSPPGLDDATKLKLLDAVAPRLLTQQGAPYQNWSARFENESGAWRFLAHGDTVQNLSDDYDLVVQPNDTAPAQVDAPQTLRYIAWHVANQTAETTEAATRGAFLGAEWSSDLPGCVQIAFSTAPTAQPTVVTVGFDLYRVVHVSGPSSTTFG